MLCDGCTFVFVLAKAGVCHLPHLHAEHKHSSSKGGAVADLYPTGRSCSPERPLQRELMSLSGKPSLLCTSQLAQTRTREQPGLWLDTGTGVLALLREHEDKRASLSLTVLLVSFRVKGYSLGYFLALHPYQSASKLTHPRAPALHWG